MRSKFYSLMFSLFLVGLGSAIFFFEITDFTYEDGTNISIGGSTSIISNTYGLEGIDHIDASGATIIIDETQVGIKVDIEYNDEITKIEPRTYSIITDCTQETNPLCESLDKVKVTTLVLSYDNLDSRFNARELINIVVDQARNKTIINVFNLMIPKITVTVNTETAKLINN